jgi:hypothetical protein
MVGTFGDDRVEIAHSINGMGKIVVVNEFGVSENSRFLPEIILDRVHVFVYLFDELGTRIQKTKAVVISFGKKFHAAGFGKVDESLHDLGAVLGELLQEYAGDTVRYSKLSVVSFDQIQ